MKRLLVAALGIVASLIAIALIINDYRSIIDVFQLADPTGSFGFYLHLGGLAAAVAAVLVTVCLLLAGSQPGFRSGFAVVAFIPYLLEALAALPCFVSSRPGALCGVGAVVVWYLSIPVVIAAAVAFVATSRRRAIKVAGLAGAAAFVGFAAGACALLAPADPAQCRERSEVTKRSNCLSVFAGRLHDENICRTIEFRTTRFLCLHEIALHKGQAGLCEEIRDDSPIKAYESPAAFYRDTCFQNMAYALHDRSQCEKVEAAQLRASCKNAVR
jgi:hypothetical protein